MRRDTVEQYLGKYVEVVLFDGDTLKGIYPRQSNIRKYYYFECRY